MEFHYFNPLDTPEKIQADYHKLALVFHPDTGGDQARFTALNVEYSRLTKDFFIPFAPYQGIRLSSCNDYLFLKSLLENSSMSSRLRQSVANRVAELENF